MPGARRLPGHVFWIPGWPHPPPTPVLIGRSAGGYRAQQPSPCLRRAAGNHVPPHGGKPEGLPDGVFGRAPVPQTRPQSGEDLPGPQSAWWVRMNSWSGLSVPAGRLNEDYQASTDANLGQAVCRASHSRGARQQRAGQPEQAQLNIDPGWNSIRQRDAAADTPKQEEAKQAINSAPVPMACPAYRPTPHR